MPRKINQSAALNFDKVWLMFQETDKKFQESERLLTSKFQETDKRFQESERLLTSKFQETDKRVKELAGLFTTQWGKLIESLVEPACVKLFQDRGVRIEQTMQNAKSQHGKTGMECDIILVNTSELVVVEVKTTFKPEYVEEFLEKLGKFRDFFPQYKNYKVLGAVASLKYEGQSDKYAYRKGLYVLRSSGEGVIKIVNDKKFEPHHF